ncbi:HAD family hydrolase [Shewanella surugensis]|uniref:HAD-IB family hydrolase n=1 Tax=Shewanella surugensis TaxID=212020 RepID=A0ABT0LFM3_9GAMM|nr:HAD family hydrolase [Shewanella surugensis]MCL1126132.1 HAD-IB family hydrolase [Shewanella surugensis]
MKLALFDFDGTLTTTETFSPFLRFAIPQKRLTWVRWCLWPLVLGYKLQLISARFTRIWLSRFCYQGMSGTELNQLGNQFALEYIPSVIYKKTLSRLIWHQQQGHEVAIVSASLDIYLRPWCKSLGIHLLCSQLEIKNNIATGQYTTGDCSGINKYQHIIRHYQLEQYETIYAYGNSIEDNEMLDIADIKYYQGKVIQ